MVEMNGLERAAKSQLASDVSLTKPTIKEFELLHEHN